MEDQKLEVQVSPQSQVDSDSVDIILADFAAYLRKLKRNQAFASIHILADYFISIARCFTVPISEYQYFLDKYYGSEIGDTDLSQTKIVAYLTSLIDRLESVTGIAFNSADLHLSSESAPETKACFETEVEEVQQLKQELADYPELSEILDETLAPSESPRSEMRETTKTVLTTFSRPPPLVSRRSSPGDPDLANILEQLPTSVAADKLDLQEETILRTVESLESFAFGKKVPLFEVLSESPNEKQSPKK